MFDVLAPFFAVAGLIAATAPIVLHMLRRTPSQQQPFTLVRFLRPAQPVMTKRSTIEHWPLLLLRILALVLIGLAFARPFQRVAMSLLTERDKGARIAVLIDASASMRRDGIREQVVQALQQIRDDLSEQDVVSVAEFSHSIRTLVTAEEWVRSEPGARQSLLQQVSEDYEPDWMETRTAAAMLNAVDEVMADQGEEPSARRIILITDFQRGSRLDELRSATWPAQVEVVLHVVSPESPGNAGISLMEDSRDGQTRVRVVNSTDAEQNEFQLQSFAADGTLIGNPVPVSVAPGQRRTVVVPTTGPDGLGVVAGVSLEDDPHAFDNVVDLPMTDVPIRRIGHIGAGDANDEAKMRYYLQRVIDGDEYQGLELVDMYQPDGVVVPVPEDVRIVFITGDVREELFPSLKQCMERGGVVVVAMDSVQMGQSLASLFPASVKLTEADIPDYGMLSRIDFESPLFAAFSGVRFSDFSSIRFWHHRRFDVAAEVEGIRTLATFDDGDPAILDWRVGSGRLLVLTAVWHPDDSQWALSTRFPPMLLNMIRLALPVSTGRILRNVGQRIAPAELIEHDQWSLEFPDKSVLLSSELSAGLAEHADRDSATEERVATGATAGTDMASGQASLLLESPGRYVLRAIASDSADPDAPAEMVLVVGLPMAESWTDPLPTGQLEALQLIENVKSANEQSSEVDGTVREQLASEELESRQQWWRWLMLAGLLCLVAESLLASGLEGRQTMETVT
ncbi:MAG: BatA domain-containing protein [Planctomycetaceae bacterium]|nr:BatA domain-containing protein [Planctomycetaceae bacterium]